MRNLKEMLDIVDTWAIMNTNDSFEYYVSLNDYFGSVEDAYNELDGINTDRFDDTDLSKFLLNFQFMNEEEEMDLIIEIITRYVLTSNLELKNKSSIMSENRDYLKDVVKLLLYAMDDNHYDIYKNKLYQIGIYDKLLSNV
jgi:hypothetical protein